MKRVGFTGKGRQETGKIILMMECLKIFRELRLVNSLYMTSFLILLNSHLG
jgi:hypothetical protein